MYIIDESKFNSKKSLLDFLVKNKNTISAQRKAILKTADCISFSPTLLVDKIEANKENDPIDYSALEELKVLVVINTTNLLDSHKDVHIPGIWDKSLRENKNIMHLQEHKLTFDHIISDFQNLKAYVKEYSWGELGYEMTGNAQALVFESVIERKRNEFMFDQYANGYVKNHSVGMRYVKEVFCVNDENYGAEYEAWQNYYPKIANKEDADATDYFWAVKEAKVIEGSAVPIGSNWATPTLDNNVKEPLFSTQYNEPSEDTQKNFYLNL